MIKKIYLLFSALLFSVVFFSCKSSFEKVRTSNEPVKMYEAANKYYDEERYLNAQILYESILPFYRGRNEAQELYYRYAYTYYNLEDYILAAHYFKNYANSFINSPHREEALFMAAYAEYLMSPGVSLEQSQTSKAISDFQIFVNTFPNSERVEECNKLIDELRQKLENKEFEQGKLYHKLGKYVSAVVVLENMLENFPETNREEEVRFLILKSSYNYAKYSVFKKQKERFEKTLEKYEQFKKRFKDSERMKEANKIYKATTKELNKF